MTRAFLLRIGLTAGLALLHGSGFAEPISSAEAPPELATRSFPVPGRPAGSAGSLAFLPSDGLSSWPRLCDAPGDGTAPDTALEDPSVRLLSLRLDACLAPPSAGDPASRDFVAQVSRLPGGQAGVELLPPFLASPTSSPGAGPGRPAEHDSSTALEFPPPEPPGSDAQPLVAATEARIPAADPPDSLWAEIDDLLRADDVAGGGDAAESEDTTAVDEAQLAEGGDEHIPGAAPDVEKASHAPWRYSVDLSDEELATRVRTDLASIGSVSLGSTSAGRILNAVSMPRGEAWRVVTPEYAFGLRETVDAVSAAAVAVAAQYPDAGPLRINHMSRKDGGHLRPHRSHQSGRDVDLGLYYKPGVDPAHIRARREDAMDPAPNWALLKHLVSHAHVDMIIVDMRIQRVLYNYALAIGEDREWLDTLFRAGYHSVVRHARGHRDHFHIRFSAPRSQELGIRVHPLLARVPAQNLTVHRVASGDTLGRIAARYGSSVELIRARNGIRGSLIRVGQRLWVPMSGPCSQCPAPSHLQVAPLRPPPPKQPDELSLAPVALPASRVALAPVASR